MSYNHPMLNLLLICVTTILHRNTLIHSFPLCQNIYSTVSNLSFRRGESMSVSSSFHHYHNKYHYLVVSHHRRHPTFVNNNLYYVGQVAPHNSPRLYSKSQRQRRQRRQSNLILHIHENDNNENVNMENKKLSSTPKSNIRRRRRRQSNKVNPNDEKDAITQIESIISTLLSTTIYLPILQWNPYHDDDNNDNLPSTTTTTKKSTIINATSIPLIYPSCILFGILLLPWSTSIIWISSFLACLSMSRSISSILDDIDNNNNNNNNDDNLMEYPNNGFNNASLQDFVAFVGSIATTGLLSPQGWTWSLFPIARISSTSSPITVLQLDSDVGGDATFQLLFFLIGLSWIMIGNKMSSPPSLSSGHPQEDEISKQLMELWDERLNDSSSSHRLDTKF